MSTNERWTGKDLRISLPFLVFGALLLAYAVGTLGNGFPVFFWGPSLALAAVFLGIGIRGTWQSLTAGRRRKEPESPGAGERSGSPDTTEFCLPLSLFKVLAVIQRS